MPDNGTLSFERARAWIGRRLILRRPLLGFEPGTRCAVMCIVDFGDGLLLWVRTDDRRLDDVDQFELADLEAHFHVLPSNTDCDATAHHRRALPGDASLATTASLLDSRSTDA